MLQLTTYFFLIGIIFIFLSFTMKNKNQDHSRINSSDNNTSYIETINLLLLEIEEENKNIEKKIVSLESELIKQFQTEIELVNKRIEKIEKNINEVKDDKFIKQPFNQIYTKYNSIIDLYNKGMDIGDIAKETNMGKGEIEFIIGLWLKEKV